jgi:hypothetical protein
VVMGWDDGEEVRCSIVPRKRLGEGVGVSRMLCSAVDCGMGSWKGTYLVRASLFLLSRLCPVSAPLSLAFMMPKDCRVGNTASRSCVGHRVSDLEVGAYGVGPTYSCAGHCRGLLGLKLERRKTAKKRTRYETRIEALVGSCGQTWVVMVMVVGESTGRGGA